MMSTGHKRIIAIWMSEPQFDPAPGHFTFIIEGVDGERIELVLTRDAAERAAELVLWRMGDNT